jgi:hypothetical protein
MKVGVVLETDQWLIKVYAPPREHAPPHVHVIEKGTGLEVKVSLLSITVMKRTRMNERSVKGILLYVWKNHSYLVECWERLHGKE